MTLDDVLKDITSHYECREGLYGYYSNTGEPYMMLGLDTPTSFGTDGPRKVYDTEALACAGFLRDFNIYAAHCAANNLGQKTILWWRYGPPYLFMSKMWQGRKGTWYDTEKPNCKLRCAVKGRLMLSDKPVLWPSQEAYDAAREEGIVRPYQNLELIH